MFTRVIGGAKYANQRLIQRCGWWLNVHIQGVLFKKKNCQVRSTLVGNDFGALWKDPRKKKKATLHVTERKLKVTFALHWQTRWGEKKLVSSVSSPPTSRFPILYRNFTCTCAILSFQQTSFRPFFFFSSDGVKLLHHRNTTRGVMKNRKWEARGEKECTSCHVNGGFPFWTLDFLLLWKPHFNQNDPKHLLQTKAQLFCIFWVVAFSDFFAGFHMIDMLTKFHVAQWKGLCGAEFLKNRECKIQIQNGHLKPKWQSFCI